MKTKKFLLICLGLFFVLGSVYAKTIYINNSNINGPWDGTQANPFQLIQEGIDAAVDGDIVLVSDGIYTGNGNRDLDFKGKAIILTSKNGAEATIIDCDNKGRGIFFHLGETDKSVLSGFTIKNGFATDGAGISCINSSSPTIENNIITKCSADLNGGGIYCNASSPAIIGNSIYWNVSVSGWGGGIHCDLSSPNIENNDIYGNRASKSGGGIILVNSSGAIKGNKIRNNSANGGGGIECSNNSSPIIMNNEISVNIVLDRGGGIYCHGAASPKILGNKIRSNTAGNGGGINSWGEPLTTKPSPVIQNNEIVNNFAINGGALFFFNSFPVIANNTVVGNLAEWFGCGIYCRNSPIVTVVNSIFRDNRPDEIYTIEDSKVNISYSNIQGGFTGEGNIDEQPGFINGHHLSDNSPCIGSGVLNANVPDTDIEGNKRPNPPESRPDMGAYENPLGRPSETIIVNIMADQTVNKGVSFSAMINVKNAKGLAGYQMDISFNPDILKVIGVQEGKVLSSSGTTYWHEPTIDNSKGLITGIAGAKTTKGSIDGDGTLAIVTFTAIAKGESYIKLQNVRLSDPNANLIPVTILEESVTVIEYPSWDVNKDGIVDTLDIVIVGQHFGEQITEPTEPNPDVNGDGVVDILDIVLVGQHFGETYSPTAPARNLWEASSEHLPLLIKLYEMIENNPNTDKVFITTKGILYRLIRELNVTQTAVFQNYPNPFNPETWIPYQLAEDSEVTIQIFNTSGNLIRILNLGYKSAGHYVNQGKSAYWNGKNEAGEIVASGIYFYTISAGKFIATRKMVITR